MINNIKLGKYLKLGINFYEFDDLREHLRLKKQKERISKLENLKKLNEKQV